MNIVLDTSAAVAYALKRKGWDAIDSILTRSSWVETPDLFMPEAANALWREHHFGSLGREQCETALEGIADLPDAFIPGLLLYKEAFAFAALAERPAYDMFFIVLARRQSATLVSLDKRLLTFAAKHDIKVFNPT